MGVLHVLDGACGWAQRVAVAQLVLGVPPDRYAQHVLVASDLPEARLNKLQGADLRVSRHSARSALFAPEVRRHADAISASVLHTWSEHGLAAAAAAVEDRAIVHSVFDPGIADRHVGLIRTVADHAPLAINCAAERVRRRIVERGVPFDRCVLLRPAVDFEHIRKFDSSTVRATLRISQDTRLFTTPPPVADSTGHFAALWAVQMRHYLEENVHLAIAGTGVEIEKLRKLADASGRTSMISLTEDRIDFEDLCLAADDLLIGDIGEVPMVAAAWAMAGKTRISAAATYATSEMLANDLNARLFKAPENWRQRAAKLAGLLDLSPNDDRLREAARGQAFEVFSLRRFKNQSIRVYDNIINQVPPFEGISDPATVGAA